MKIKYLLLTLVILTATDTFAQVGIGTNTPVASAALEVSSSTNNKGILIPRITATQKDAISNPAEGLMVYQTSSPVGFYYYNGSAWKLMVTQTDLDTKVSTVDATISLNTKVDKITGKELSSNDYTSTEKTKLAAISGNNTGDQDLSAFATTASVALKANTTDVNTSLATKVDKVTGKDLSSNDYTSTEKTKLAAITGTNTGDQDLSALATAASVALKANITDVNTALALKAPLASPSLVTPNIGVATGTSLSVSGQLTSTIATGTAPLVVSSTTPVANLSIGGNAATATLASTVTTNANLTGDVISSGSNVTRIDAGRVTNDMLAGSIDLASKVTGILPSSNGGTGNGFTNITGPTTSVKTFTLPDASATILTSNAAVSVAQGGTGQTTYTDGQLLIGNTTGNTLTKATLTPGAGISITNTSGAITIASTNGLPSSGNSTGEMLYWNGTAWVRVAPSQYEGAYLQSKGGVPTWLLSSGTTTEVVQVTNPTTGKIWMDRNLGATQVATSSTDAASYGDLYQWGRGTDGHQIRTSATTTSLSSSDNPRNANFITINSGNYDWRSGQNDNLWQGVNGINNPCPTGYRLPTETEWVTEYSSWISRNPAGALASTLKLPLAGARLYTDGRIFIVGTYGYYWSSTVSTNFSRVLDLDEAFMDTFVRAYGFSVRCIKD